MSYHIEIYIKKNCPYCDRARLFFKQRLLNFKEISVDDGVLSSSYLEMYRRSGGCRTVPQIFINNHHVGGSDDLLKFNQSQDVLKYFL